MAVLRQEIQILSRWYAEPIVYPLALTKSKSEAAGFVIYLITSQGHEVFIRYGFIEPTHE